MSRFEIIDEHTVATDDGVGHDVLEAIAASHLHMQVLGLSLATNLAAGLSPVPLDGDHVLAVARDNAPWVADLLARIIRAIAGERVAQAQQAKQ